MTKIDKKSWFIGISLAASWAWGVSLLVALAIIEGKGLIPFGIWAGMNILAIPVFGYVIRKLDHLQTQINNGLLKMFMIVVQLFSMWVQMQALYEAGVMAGMGPYSAKIFAVITGLFFVFAILKGGLKLSMLTDQVQWGITLLGLVILIIMGIINGESQTLIAGNTPQNMSWAWYTVLILFCGPFVDLQGWQRAKVALKEKAYKSFRYAGYAFAIYMFMILIFAFFARSSSMNIILLIVAFMVATSTLDSNSAALQELGEKWGFILGFVAAATWPLVVKYGIVGLWTFVGTWRIFVVIAMLLIALYKKINKQGRV